MKVGLAAEIKNNFYIIMDDDYKDYDTMNTDDELFENDPKKKKDGFSDDGDDDEIPDVEEGDVGDNEDEDEEDDDFGDDN